MIDREILITIIRDNLGAAPDGPLAESLSKMCREFPTDSDPVVFLRDLLDLIVYIGGADRFTMTAIREVLLDGQPPETEADKAARRERLAQRHGLE